MAYHSLEDMLILPAGPVRNVPRTAGELEVGDKIRSTYGLVYTVMSTDAASGERVALRLLGRLPWSLTLPRTARVDAVAG